MSTVDRSIPSYLNFKQFPRHQVHLAAVVSRALASHVPLHVSQGHGERIGGRRGRRIDGYLRCCALGMVDFGLELERNSIALLKSQQTFQQRFYSGVGHPVVLETLLKSLLRFQQSY